MAAGLHAAFLFPLQLRTLPAIRKVGGDVEQFRAGDIHRMALEAPLDQQWMGGIIDKYFSQKGTRYWAIWTVKAS